MGGWAGNTAPPIFGSVDLPAAKIFDSDAVCLEVIEVGGEPASRGFKGNVDRFVGESILGDYGAGDGGRRVDVDACRAGGRRIFGVGCIPVNVVADNDVVVEVDAGSRGWGVAVIAHGYTGQAVTVQFIAGNYIGRVGCARAGSEDAYASSGAGQAEAVVVRFIVRDDIVHDAIRESGDGSGGIRCRMAGHGDAAGIGVVMHIVAFDQVVGARSGFIGDEDAAGIVLNQVAHDRGVIGRHKVDAFAAVHLLIGCKGGNAEAGALGRVKGFVVVEHMIVKDGNVRAIRDQDAFEVCVAHGEAGDDYIGYAGIRCGGHAVDKDAVGFPFSVDDRLGEGGGAQGERLRNGD